MTTDTKQAIYGAVRNQRINELRNTVMEACHELMYAKEPVPVTFHHPEGNHVVHMDPVDAIVISLEAMMSEIARLEAGRTA